MPFPLPKTPRTRLNTNARDRDRAGALVAKTCVELFALGRAGAAAAVFEGFVSEDPTVEHWERACVALEFIEALQDGLGRRMLEEGQADVAQEWLAQQFEAVAADIDARRKKVTQGDRDAGEWSWLDTRAEIALSEAVGAAASADAHWTGGALREWANDHPKRTSVIAEAVQSALISDSRRGLAENAGAFLIHPQRELWKMQDQVAVLRENAETLARRSPNAMAAMVAEVAERLNDGSLPLSIAVSAGQIALSAWASDQIDRRHDNTHISEWKDKSDRFALSFFEKIDALIQACSPDRFWASEYWRALDESQDSKNKTFVFGGNQTASDKSEGQQEAGARIQEKTPWDTLRFACWNAQLGPNKEDVPEWTRWFIKLREKATATHGQRAASGVSTETTALSPQDFMLTKSDLTNLIAKSKTAQFAIIHAVDIEALTTNFASWGIPLGEWHSMCSMGMQKWVKNENSLDFWDTAFTAVCKRAIFAPSGAAWIGLSHIENPTGALSPKNEEEMKKIKESNGSYYDADASIVIRSARSALCRSSATNPTAMVLLAFQEMGRRKTPLHAQQDASITIESDWSEGRKIMESLEKRGRGTDKSALEKIEAGLEALVLSRIADISRGKKLGPESAQTVSEAPKRGPRL